MRDDGQVTEEIKGGAWENNVGAFDRLTLKAIGRKGAYTWGAPNLRLQVDRETVQGSFVRFCFGQEVRVVIGITPIAEAYKLGRAGIEGVPATDVSVARFCAPCTNSACTFRAER